MSLMTPVFVFSLILGASDGVSPIAEDEIAFMVSCDMVRGTSFEESKQKLLDWADDDLKDDVKIQVFPKHVVNKTVSTNGFRFNDPNKVLDGISFQELVFSANDEGGEKWIFNFRSTTDDKHQASFSLSQLTDDIKKGERNKYLRLSALFTNSKPNIDAGKSIRMGKCILFGLSASNANDLWSQLENDTVSVSK